MPRETRRRATAAEEFELLDSRELTENSWVHLAVAGEEIFVRDLAGLTVYRWRRP